MKKIMSVTLAMSMVLGLTACGGPATASTAASTEASTAAASAAAETTTAAAETTQAAAEAAVDTSYPEDIFHTGAAGENGAASSANEAASKIAVEIMKQGGNAVDAAVGMAYAVGMLEPAASGIGGCGQMMIYLKEQDKYVVVEYMTQAPAAAIAGTIETSATEIPPSPEAIAIPGFVNGTLTALEQYGTMTPAQVLAPVIKLAREGFEINSRWNSNLEGKYDGLLTYDYSMNLYTDNGFMWNEGDVISNNDLADTMQLIADEGIKGFYDSAFTDKLVGYIQSMGGVITREDFAQYQCKIREPISTTYHGYTIYTGSAPSNGGAALLEILNILENFNLKSYPRDSSKFIQLVADAYGIAYEDCTAYIADPDYYDLPLSTITSKSYAASRASEIKVGQMLASPAAGDMTVKLSATGEEVLRNIAPEQGGTTHMTCMDSMGNVVSMTNTLGVNFGSCLAVPGTGFPFNAHLGNLSNNPVAAVNMLMPYSRVRSTVCPSILVDPDGKPVMAVGSPGNWALVSATLNAIINYVDYDMDVASAVLAGRSWRSGTALYLDNKFSDSTVQALKDMGFEIHLASGEFSSSVGNVSAVCVGDDGRFYAIGDYRRHYGSAAY